MQYAIIDRSGTIKNIIVYDGNSPYNPGENFTIELVNDWLGIGMNKDDPEPDLTIDQEGES